MPYRTKVKVIYLAHDETKDDIVPILRKDMGFTVLVRSPDEVMGLVKDTFNARWGPDVIIRTAGLQDRTNALLYCMDKSAVRNVARIKGREKLQRPPETISERVR